MRLAALDPGMSVRRPTRTDVEAALRAHLCRCTGWQSIVEAACDALSADDPAGPAGRPPRSAARLVAGPGGGSRLPERRSRRGPRCRWIRRRHAPPPARRFQLGADAPLSPDLRAARARTGRIQGRRSTVPLRHPLELPAGDWVLTLRTTWVEPAYVEPDASWCCPAGRPAPPWPTGGRSEANATVPSPACPRLADETVTRCGCCGARGRGAAGAQRPPLALGLRSDGTGVVRIARPAGSLDLGPARRGWRRAPGDGGGGGRRWPGPRWDPTCAGRRGPR